ncbi:MAG TPA: hypothetical protein PLE45_02165 [Spirochaetota bacterium]|nr:hypothetical protein [Spirochaetota bacterium]HOL57491.1 hypothetical protein [Spirochaetota bacterium]HPP04422.1 hypothetical protein [Spirochaetota bacterium]
MLLGVGDNNYKDYSRDIEYKILISSKDYDNDTNNRIRKRKKIKLALKYIN